ncbi:MAG: hypothetical protein CL833_05915 [Crocinitomicaceae bacterium]|nr:hypothetical protein [Crocinitomicaceae bacterium]|tara:strand:- start:671 stop:1885 length:1215 start_codon:yes stop_codon:yes gene_type:complete
MTQETLATPQESRPSRLRGLWDRLRGRSNPERLETEPDKAGYDDPPVQSPEAMNLKNLAINDSFNSDEILQEAQNLPKNFSKSDYPGFDFGKTYEDSFSFPSLKDAEQSLKMDNLGIKPVLRLEEPTPPPLPKTYKGYPISIPKEDENYVFMGNRDKLGSPSEVYNKWYPKNELIKNFSSDLGKTTMEQHALHNFPDEISSQMHNFQTPDLSNLSDTQLKSYLARLYQPIEGDREDLFKRLVDARTGGIDPKTGENIMMQAAEYDAIPKVQQGTLARMNRESSSQINSPQQPYPENWNPQANTRANRAWGAQNIANREAEMAQEQARVSGLGNAARGAQAAEALPGAAARAGNAAAGGYTGLSNFSARTLPIINLGLLGYGLYNQAKNNRENEKYKKMVEGNRI